MGIFRKKKVHTIDFTKLPNSHVVQPNKNLKFEGDVVDLRNSSSGSYNTSVGPAGMDFLDTMANSSSTPKPSKGILTQVSEVSELKINMRKLTGKLEDSDNQVYRLLQRIELLEKKIDRFENRGG